ncbi:MAG: hypothetical protein HQL23_04330 [Candidatus Omnitrophica bacterium]|nr:hypothetical protein [Candidatus Omnitrophota bacterium]
MNLFAKKKTTAEQKLLQMIEASQGSGEGGVLPQQKAVRKQSLLAVIKILNGLLVLAVIGAACLLAGEVSRGSRELAVKVNFPSNVKASSGDIAGAMPAAASVRPETAYLASISDRNIFQPYEEKVKGEMAATGVKKTIALKAAKLRLVGISWLDRVDTASVMLEDTEKQATYFLQVGEKIGDIIVKTIYADSALIGYENEEMIIKYDKPQM